MPKPVAFYPLNGSFTTNDEQRRLKFRGTANNVNLTYGPNNETDGAYEFYGNRSSYIEFDNRDGILDVKYSITLMCWVRPGGQDGPLFVYGPFSRFPVGIGISDGGFCSHVPFSSGSNRDQTSTDHSLKEGTWVHVAATYNQSTGDNYIYVDGVEKSRQNIGGGQIAANFSKVRMGTMSGPDNDFSFKGAITQMRVYNDALRADQILAVMNQGNS